jgi:Restriction Enzyme Adenine Methylase Associated
MDGDTELLRLIRDGRLQPGTILIHHERGGSGLGRRAMVVLSGIELGGTVYRTPTAAANAAVGGSNNGWTFWRVDGRGPFLADFRPSSPKRR